MSDDDATFTNTNRTPDGPPSPEPESAAPVPPEPEAAEPETVGDLPQGQRLGDFEVLAEIGAGTQGVVYRARCAVNNHDQLALGDLVALKVMRLDPGEDGADRIEPYRGLLGPAPHPGIVRYHDAFTADGEAVLVLELVEGESLAQRLKRFEHGSWDTMKPLVLQILDALIALGDQGVVHRDIKPSNVFINHDGVIKLIDLDLTPRATEESDEDQTVMWQGSLEYMAPDFLRVPGFQGDTQSDIFSAGVLLFQCLTGRLPFPSLGERADIGYVERWQKGDAPINFRLSAFRVLDQARETVAKALASDRAKRFTNFREMRKAVETIAPKVVTFKNGDAYELLSMLGKGGFGEVFKAVRQRDGKVFAIKHLTSSDYAKRFLKEAAILKDYGHECIVGYEDLLEREADKVGDVPDYHLVMEFLPGETLSRRIRNEPDGLDPQEAMQIFVRYLRAMDHLHAHPQQIIHRDIKPGNLYAPEGHPENAKIFDLGIARDVSGTETFGHIPGTLAYMPPEFARADGGRGTPQSDIYAMGFCLYETLVGESVAPRLPRDMDQAYIAYFKRSQRPLVIDFDKPVFRRYPGLMRVVGYALAYDVDARYESAASMADDLEKILLPGAEVEDYDVTLANMIGPKTVINEEYAKRHMPEPDAMPKILPSEAIRLKKRRAKQRKAALVALAFIGASAAVGLAAGYYFRSDPVAGLDPRQQALYEEHQGFAPGIVTAESLDQLTAAHSAFTNWRGKIQSTDTNFLEQAGVLQTSLVTRARTLFDIDHRRGLDALGAGRYGTVSNALDQLARFQASPLSQPEFAVAANALRGDLGERIATERAAAQRLRAAVADLTNRVARIEASGVGEWPELIRPLLAARDGLPPEIRDSPQYGEPWDALLHAMATRLGEAIAAERPLDARSANLARVAAVLDLPLDLAATREELRRAMALHLVDIANPHQVPARLVNDLASAEIPAGSNVLLRVNVGTDPVETSLRFLRDGGFAPADLAFTFRGGEASRVTVPEFSLMEVRLEIGIPALDPPVSAERLGPNGTWLPLAAGFTNLPPASHRVRFLRTDYEPREDTAVLAPAQEGAVLDAPVEGWRPGPALLDIRNIQAALEAENFAQAETLLAAARKPQHPAHLDELDKAEAQLEQWRAAELAKKVAALKAQIADAEAWAGRYQRYLHQLANPDLANREDLGPWRRDWPFPNAMDLAAATGEPRVRDLLLYDGTPQAVDQLAKDHGIQAGQILGELAKADKDARARAAAAFAFPPAAAKLLDPADQARLAKLTPWAKAWPQLLNRKADQAAVARAGLAGFAPHPDLVVAHQRFRPDRDGGEATMDRLVKAQNAGAAPGPADLHLALRATLHRWMHNVDSIPDDAVRAGVGKPIAQRFAAETAAAKAAADQLRQLLGDAEAVDFDIAMHHFQRSVLDESEEDPRWIVLLKGVERLAPPGKLYDARRLNQTAAWLNGDRAEQGVKEHQDRMLFNLRKISGLSAVF